MIETSKECEIQHYHCEQTSTIPSMNAHDDMSSTNILIIDDQGLILSDNLSKTTESSSPLPTGFVIKNIEMIHWKDEHAADENSVENSTSIPSLDDTEVTSFADSFSLEAQQTQVAEKALEEILNVVNGNENDIHEHILQADEEDPSRSEIGVMESAYFSNVNTEKVIRHSIINPVHISLNSGCDSTTEIECSIFSESQSLCDDGIYDVSVEKAGPTRRRVHFAMQLITGKYEFPCWSPEEKASLFYTGKELHQFRVDHMIELYESQDATMMNDWSKFEGRRSLRILWSFYSVLMDFLSCKALTQCCFGGGKRDVQEATA